MKTAYPESLLDRYSILEEWDQWKDLPEVKNLDLEAEIAAVRAGIFQPPFWIRCALFFATLLGASLASGFFALIFLSSFFSGVWGGLVQAGITAVVFFLVCRHFIEKKNHFRSGLDDALALLTVCCIGGVSFLIRDALNLPTFEWYTFILAGAALAFFSRYYLDRFMAFCSIGLVLSGISIFLGLLGPAGLLGFPFAVFLVGLVLAATMVRLKRNNNPYLEDWLNFLLVCGLVLTVFSIQFFPVRYLFIEFFPGNEQMPYSLIFKILSVLVPSLVLVWGIQKKERAALWVGFLGIAFALYMTIFAIFMLPSWVALIFTGLLFLIPGWWIYMNLKNGKVAGFEMNANAKEHFLQDFLTHAIQTSTVVQKPAQNQGPGFGQGKFGGGGASESF